jgi:hypothetical protein
MLASLLLLLGCAAASNETDIMAECESNGGVDQSSDTSVACVIQRVAKLYHLTSPIELYTAVFRVLFRAACAPYCRLLVFGAGVDAGAWLLFNSAGRGTTIIVDTDSVRLINARLVAPLADLRRVTLATRAAACLREVDDLDARYWQFMSRDIDATDWDAVVIRDNAVHGILPAVWWASRNLAMRPREAHVFIEQSDRECAKYLGNQFFTVLFQVRPVEVATERSGHFAHWSIDRQHNSLGHGLVGGPGQFRVVSLTTRVTPTNDSDCVKPMVRILGNSLVRFGLIDRRDHVHVEIPLIGSADKFGKYGSQGFRQATFLKTEMVLAGLRMGIDLLLTDIDIIYIAPIPFTRFRDIFNTYPNVHIIAQQELTDKCPKIIDVNTGFYCIRASSWSLRFLHQVMNESRGTTQLTEQLLWNRVLNYLEPNRRPFAECTNRTNIAAFGVESALLPVALLPMTDVPNGFWMWRSAIKKPFMRHFNFIIGYCKKMSQLQKYASNVDVQLLQ